MIWSVSVIYGVGVIWGIAMICGVEVVREVLVPTERTMPSAAGELGIEVVVGPTLLLLEFLLHPFIPQEVNRNRISSQVDPARKTILICFVFMTSFSKKKLLSSRFSSLISQFRGDQTGSSVDTYLLYLSRV